MAELKTRPNRGSVKAFLARVPAERRRECQVLVRMMKRATGRMPKMWGPSIVGFGRYDYRYASGREGSWFLTGFSPRKQDLTIYIMSGFVGHKSLMAKLGKYKTGKSCLYLKQLEDVDLKRLEALIVASVERVQEHWGS